MKTDLAQRLRINRDDLKDIPSLMYHYRDRLNSVRQSCITKAMAHVLGRIPLPEERVEFGFTSENGQEFVTYKEKIVGELKLSFYEQDSDNFIKNLITVAYEFIPSPPIVA